MQAQALGVVNLIDNVCLSIGNEVIFCHFYRYVLRIGMLEIYGPQKAVWLHHMDYIFNGFHFEMLLFNLWRELLQINNDTQLPIPFNPGEEVWVVAPVFIWRALFNDALIQEAIYFKV